VNARSTIKTALEIALVGSGFAAARRRAFAGRTLILAYHNVVADESAQMGDLANHLPLSTFAAQMAELRATHDVVPLPDVLAAGKTGRPQVAITFDDAYRGAIVNAVPVLVRLGLPATFFVAPAFVGGGSFWWDVLAKPNGGGLDPADRDRALDELRGEDGPVRAWAKQAGRTLNEPSGDWRVATEAQLLDAASQPGITLGSHTWGHPNLTRLTPDELASEMSRPLAWLRERVPNTLPWIAYPYGHFDSSTEAAARAAGYEAGLAVSGGWMGRTVENRFALPRLNIPRGLSRRGFTLRGAGLLAG
jgi:peptidoglycan/xylan/chitin deacetylase (PgdA/CDA1 family)